MQHRNIQCPGITRLQNGSNASPRIHTGSDQIRPIRHARSERRMNPQQKRFIDDRLREHAKTQPEILKLKKILLKVGGKHLVAPGKITGDIPMLVDSGFVMDYPTRIKLMEANMCHLNSAMLFATG